MPSFAVKKRLPQSALTRSTEGRSGQLERWGNSTPAPAWTGRAVEPGAKESPQKYRFGQFGELIFLNGLTVAPVPHHYPWASA
jgi:hypothetical protein